jgi:hypothetical protein
MPLVMGHLLSKAPNQDLAARASGREVNGLFTK